MGIRPAEKYPEFEVKPNLSNLPNTSHLLQTTTLGGHHLINVSHATLQSQASMNSAAGMHMFQPYANYNNVIAIALNGTGDGCFEVYKLYQNN